MANLQRTATKLVRAGYDPAKAVLMLSKLYRLSLADCELLYFAVSKR